MSCLKSSTRWDHHNFNLFITWWRLKYIMEYECTLPNFLNSNMYLWFHVVAGGFTVGYSY